ncbi:unnamed protein product [Effrenium voratum]|nr:unnamed protein product [Effrenium voratum]
MESFPSGDLGGRLLVAAYGAVSLHHWCQRLLRLSSVTDECHFYLDILTKIIGESTVVTEEGQLRVHERRRIALKQIAALWSLVLDTFLISLFASQVLGLVKPMVGGFAFFATVSTGSIVLSRLGDPHLELTPARLNRDMTIMSFLVFGATLGMPRELMPACYMARMLCFSFTTRQLSNKVNIMLAPFYLMSHWINTPPDAPMESLLFNVFGEIVAVALMMLILTNLDTKETQLASATLELEAKVEQVEEAEREGGAAQRLLSVTCDAFVRLTHELKIKTPSRSLFDLLMCHFGSGTVNQLEGTPFIRYIAPAEHQRFKDFIDESSKASAPPRSLHIDMKDSSGVTFSAELFHVTVPSLSGEQEHLIGISNDNTDQYADRSGRESANTQLSPSWNIPQPEQQSFADAKSFSAQMDMKHILGYGVLSGKVSQGSRGSKSSKSSNSSGSSRKADLKRLHSLSSIGIVIDATDTNHDFLIRSLTLSFSSPAQCGKELLPNLMEWLKPSHRQNVSNWIQSHANAHFAGRPCQESPHCGAPR